VSGPKFYFKIVLLQCCSVGKKELAVGTGGIALTGSTTGKHLGEGKRNTEMHPLPYLTEDVLF